METKRLIVSTNYINLHARKRLIERKRERERERVRVELKEILMIIEEEEKEMEQVQELKETQIKKSPIILLFFFKLCKRITQC